MHQEISDWLEGNLDVVPVQHYVSIHIDQLLQYRPAQQEMVDTSMRVFLTLREFLKLKTTNAFPMLVIPLRTISSSLSLVVPDSLSAVTSDLDEEPPGLYLLSRQSLEHADHWEEYKYPLSFDLITTSPGGIYAYYSESRDPKAIINQWEYSRCIYVKPDPLFS